MNLFIIRPFTKCTACKFRTVVGKDLLRKSSEKCNSVQYIDYFCSTERCVRLKSKTFTSCFIYYSENTKLTSVCESIGYKIERPSNIRYCNCIWLTSFLRAGLIRFLNHQLECLIVQRQISYNLLKSSVLIFELFKTLCFTNLHTAIFRFPTI